MLGDVFEEVAPVFVRGERLAQLFERRFLELEFVVHDKVGGTQRLHFLETRVTVRELPDQGTCGVLVTQFLEVREYRSLFFGGQIVLIRHRIRYQPILRPILSFCDFS